MQPHTHPATGDKSYVLPSLLVNLQFETHSVELSSLNWEKNEIVAKFSDSTAKVTIDAYIYCFATLLFNPGYEQGYIYKYFISWQNSKRFLVWKWHVLLMQKSENFWGQKSRVFLLQNRHDFVFSANSRTFWILKACFGTKNTWLGF